MKVGFVSLGCPKNQLDTEVMLHEVASAGYEITPEETEAPKEGCGSVIGFGAVAILAAAAAAVALKKD